jgi:CDP-diacylglycerol--glycerol-3-phosphate 3-phosphatidyltransferase
LLHYLWTGVPALNVFLIFATIVGSTMISYARARAGALHVDCEVGLLPRSERVVLIALALLLNLVTPALWILAIGTQITAAQRLLYVWEVTSGRRPRS